MRYEGEAMLVGMLDDLPDLYYGFAVNLAVAKVRTHPTKDNIIAAVVAIIVAGEVRERMKADGLGIA